MTLDVEVAELVANGEPGYDPTEYVGKDYQDEKAESIQRREQRNDQLQKFIENLPRVERIVTECDRDSAHDIAEVDVIRKALGNPNASNGSIDTARCKARRKIRAEMIRLGYFPNEGGRRNHG